MAAQQTTTTTGIPAGRPIPVDLERCFDCGTRVPHNTGRCFPCQLGVKLRAAAVAMDEVRWAIAHCRICATAFGYAGPADGRMCQHCREVW